MASPGTPLSQDTTAQGEATESLNEEHVLVVPTPLFHELGHFQGFSAEVDRYLAPILGSDELSYRPRSAMEIDPSFKQLIPYVLFRHTDASGVVRLFSYLRGGGAGEKRLRAKRSVGVGGHISTLDADAPSGDVYQAGLDRELSEEVAIDSSYTQRRAGLINDDETEVGRVHLGVVHLFDLEEPKVRSQEDDLAEGCFLPAEEILANIEGYETWSQIVVRALFETAS
ncbi:hypothetical protein Mal64_18510 [Pseudobythopirellula maris]|uniref:Nudix hydrolase domain-containing protein n=1 Tax=Pseudobythopirellula maris TaxID=2527991 RepID=A0A5C5ZNF0_9BACT|nr:phosphoesterase [Pseudobythopirellula maris]TWT88371.1 hypothetical protein Mal64_18510 [Pseudobythopirellula maris]